MAKSRTIQILLLTIVQACGGHTIAADVADSGQSDAQAGEGDAKASVVHTRRVCDGSVGIRLAIAYISGTGGLMYSGVVFELGHPFIYVDGACRFWLATWSEDPRARWRPIRTGILSDVDQQTLADSIHYDDLPGLVAACQFGGNSDGGSAALYDGEHTIGCASGTPTLKPAEVTWFDLGPKLYAAGAPVVGDLRVEVGEGIGPVPRSVPYPWPLTTPIQDFVVQGNDALAVGKSKRLSDPSEVAKLLTLRETYLQDQEAHNLSDSGIIIYEAGRDYVLYFREDVPFTGEDGLTTFFGAR